MPPFRFDRRTILASGLAAGVAGLSSGAQGTALAASGVVQPHRADQLVGHYGVVAHLHFMDTVYAEHDQVLVWLRRLGVRHVRTRLSPRPRVLEAMANLARAGIKVNAVCGALGDDQSMDSLMRTVRQHFDRPGEVFSAFEGINEPNNDDVRWVGETRRKTRELHAARAAYHLEGIPIVAPALARVNGEGKQGGTTDGQVQRLGDLTDFVDFGNMHVYPRGLPPSTDIGRFRRAARHVSGQAPVLCTEGGYFTAMDYQGGANPVPESVAAAYGPQALLEHWSAGTRRFFRYDLLEDPHVSQRDRNGTLGMISTGGTWTPKQEFWPMQRLLATFADPGPRFQPRPLPMRLTDRPPDLKHAVFAKRDGTHQLAIWLDRPIWDTRDRRMLVSDSAATIDRVRLELDSPRDISVRHLTDLDSPASSRTASATEIDLTPGVTLVRLA